MLSLLPGKPWKIQTITYVATMIYHRGEDDMKLAYQQAMRKVIDVLHGPALQVAMEMETEQEVRSLISETWSKKL